MFAGEEVKHFIFSPAGVEFRGDVRGPRYEVQETDVGDVFGSGVQSVPQNDSRNRVDVEF